MSTQLIKDIHVTSFRNQSEAFRFQNILAKNGLCTILQLFPVNGWYRIKTDVQIESVQALEMFLRTLRKQVRTLRKRI